MIRRTVQGMATSTWPAIRPPSEPRIGKLVRDLGFDMKDVQRDAQHDARHDQRQQQQVVQRLAPGEAPAHQADGGRHADGEPDRGRDDARPAG